MQHLRLVGVHEDGTHLLLTDDDGNRFALPLDEPLRAAARRDRPRLGQLQIEISGELRPRDVQAMIRAGMSAEEVAERAGWPVEKVHRYEGPILAEREHVAGLARQVRLRARGASHGVSPTLDARVADRLRSRQIDLDTVRWDSRRADRGAWTVVLRFSAGGREREAAWDFDPLARTVSAHDDEARWLSEDEEQDAPGPIPAPHLAPSNRPSRVFDVEAEGGVEGGVEATARRTDGQPVDLMAAMRERSTQRGRRRRPRPSEVPGMEHAPEEALPLEELAADPREELPPPAHTHPEDDPEVTRHGSVEERVGAEAAARRARRAERTQPVHQAGGEADDQPVEGSRRRRTPAPAARRTPRSARPSPPAPPVDVDDGAGVDDEVDTREVLTIDTGTQRRPRRSPAADVDAAVDQPDGEDDGELIEERASASARPAPSRRPASTRKSGRPSVPSWDDIMFGRRSD